MKLALICFCLSATTSFAQHKIGFSSQNYAGLLEGENGSTFQLQTINGIKYKTWSAGLGVGLDWYFLRSVPLFFSLDKTVFEKNNNGVFISADIGANYPWRRHYPDEWDYGSTGKYHNGTYFASGIGYKISVGKRSDALLLHLGYSYKDMSEKITTVYPCLIGPCPEQTETYNFHLRRLSFKMGWNF